MYSPIANTNIILYLPIHFLTLCTMHYSYNYHTNVPTLTQCEGPLKCFILGAQGTLILLSKLLSQASFSNFVHKFGCYQSSNLIYTSLH